MNDDLIRLSPSEFDYLAKLLYERFGIHLGEQKKVLMAGRLSKRLRELGLPDFSRYIEFLESDRTGAELTELVNRITTNHSFFFREPEHFDFLTGTVLPGLEGAMRKQLNYPLRIWSAGCATGEEVYSIGMLLREYYGQRIRSIDYGLLATDISLAALKEAEAGVYSGGKLRDLPAGYRMSHFRQETEDSFAISDDIRRMVLFKRLNLMSGTFPMRGQFDAVFCRNVMIYFDQESRDRAVRSIYRCVKPGGFFFIGHSESLKKDDCPFSYVKPAVYRKGDD